MNKKDREEIEYEVELRSTMEEFSKAKKTIAKILDKKKLEQEKKFLAYSKMLERAHMPKETLLELKEAHTKYLPLGQKSQEIFKEFFPEYVPQTVGEVEEDKDTEIFNKMEKIRKATGISHLSPRKHELLQNQKTLTRPPTAKSRTSASSQQISQSQHQLELIEKNSHISVDEDPLPSLEERISAIPQHPISIAFPGQKNVILNQLESMGAENFYNYKGNYKNSHLSGIGKYWYIDGGTYDGYWINDIPDGQGTAVYSDGSSYIGTFKNSLFHGYGVMTDSVGNKYDGHWMNGKRSGSGTITYNNGLLYNGMFVNDKINGQGEMISISTGFHYIGQWRNNKICGKGILINDRVEGVKYERVWPEKSFHDTIKELKEEIIKRKKENEKKLYEISSYTRKHKLELYVESVRQTNKQIEEANKLRLQQMKDEEERKKKLLEDNSNNSIPHPPPPKPPSGPPPQKQQPQQQDISQKNQEDRKENEINVDNKDEGEEEEEEEEEGGEEKEEEKEENEENENKEKDDGMENIREQRLNESRNSDINYNSSNSNDAAILV